MANNYATVPAIIPGDLTIAGNLKVQGGQFQLGKLVRKYRIQELANGFFAETVNLDQLAGVQDDPTFQSVRRDAYVTGGLLTISYQAPGVPGFNNIVLQVTASAVQVLIDQLIVGSVVPYLRLAKGSPTGGGVSLNLANDGATRDVTSRTAYAHYFETNPPVTIEYKMLNAAGAAQTMATRSVLFADSTYRGGTGAGGDFTILSRVIRGNVIGANGILQLRVWGSAGTVASGAVTFTAKIGASSFPLQTIGASVNANYCLTFIFAARNAANDQTLVTNAAGSNLGVTSPPVETTVDTTVDQTLTLTAHFNQVTDGVGIFAVECSLLNSWGPL